MSSIPSYIGSTFLILSLALSAVQGQILTLTLAPFPTFPVVRFACGALGESCCKPPPHVPANPALGPLVKCNTGLGCDITTKKCVAPCGRPGGACCDGSDTRALGWTRDGAVFSPTSMFLKEMCESGTCDKPSHRCVRCASSPGTACCPPDASQATARCISADNNLQCVFDADSDTSGVCQLCGGIGNPPCGGDCSDNLKLDDRGLCVECGGANQITCETLRYPCNQGCKPHLIARSGFCRPCGDVAQIPCPIHNRSIRPCANYVDWDGCRPGLGQLSGLCQACGIEGKVPCSNGCASGLKTKHGICTQSCGRENQAPCDDGTCYPPLGTLAGACRACGRENQQPCDGGFCHSPLQVIGRVCKTCGAEGKPPCPQGGCRPPFRLRQGLCARCGSEGRPPCDAGCDVGLLAQRGVCSSTCGKEGFLPCDAGCRDGLREAPLGTCERDAACATEGQACVTGDFGTAGTGPLCCTAGGPFVCEFAVCRRCIPHGADVPLGGTQRCCERDDFVVADGEGGQKCDVP